MSSASLSSQKDRLNSSSSDYLFICPHPICFSFPHSVVTFEGTVIPPAEKHSARQLFRKCVWDRQVWLKASWQGQISLSAFTRPNSALVSLIHSVPGNCANCTIWLTCIASARKWNLTKQNYNCSGNGFSFTKMWNMPFYLFKVSFFSQREYWLT